MTTSETQIKEQVEADFAFMQEALASSNPDIMDLLQVYGDQEAAVRQVSDYLAILTPQPSFFTTDRSS
jgi:hypothetical protein